MRRFQQPPARIGRATATLLLVLSLNPTIALADQGLPPLTVEGSIGGALALSDGAFSHLKLEQSVGWRLTDRAGPVAGAALQESFGPGGFVMQLGPRLSWAFRPWKGVALDLVPLGQLGYAAVYFTGPFDLGGWAHRFDIQLACQLEMPLWQKWRAVVRPVAFDLQIDDDGLAARYDLMLGLGRQL